MKPKKPTGPRSAEGKTCSSMNALKSGIYSQSIVIPGEDPEALSALSAEYHQRCSPAHSEQRDQVDILIRPPGPFAGSPLPKPKSGLRHGSAVEPRRTNPARSRLLQKRSHAHPPPTHRQFHPAQLPRRPSTSSSASRLGQPRSRSRPLSAPSPSPDPSPFLDLVAPAQPIYPQPINRASGVRFVNFRSTSATPSEAVPNMPPDSLADPLLP